jgi:hypothetical protein
LRFDREIPQQPTAAPQLLTRDVTRQMQNLFDRVVAEPLPDHLTVLLQQLDQPSQRMERG